MRSGSMVGRLMFGAALAVSLGIGARSALATPAPPADKETVCYSGACYRECKDNGWAGGSCQGGSTGWCECW